MRMKNAFLALLVAVAAPACLPEGIQIPGQDAVFICDREDGCPLWDVDNVSSYMDRFSNAWEADFFSPPALPHLVIVKDALWGDMNFKDEKGWDYMGYCNYDEVHIIGSNLHTGEGIQFHKSSFAHEMVHSALVQDPNIHNGDKDHSEGEGPWSERHDRFIGLMVRDVVGYY
jgi:hypothetical protein